MTSPLRPRPSLMKPIVACAMLSAAALGLVACNTVAGAGKDVSNTGTAITHTAHSVEQKM